MKLNPARGLEVYQKPYRVAMRVHEVGGRLPSEEKYTLTSQIRRSSRSVCLNVREPCAKRRYEVHFISNLTNCDGENSETNPSSDFARDCQYIALEVHEELTGLCQGIGLMLGSTINRPGPFLISDR